RSVPERAALGKVGERVLAETDEFRGRDAERVLEELVLERSARPFGKRHFERRFAHVSSPVSTWARCTARTRDARRERPPPICMRHPASHATRYSAPVRSTLSSFLSRMADDTAASRTEKEPPNPQHSSAPVSSTSSTPGRPFSRTRGQRDSPSPRRRWQES